MGGWQHPDSTATAGGPRQGKGRRGNVKACLESTLTQTQPSKDHAGTAHHSQYQWQHHGCAKVVTQGRALPALHRWWTAQGTVGPSGASCFFPVLGTGHSQSRPLGSATGSAPSSRCEMRGASNPEPLPIGQVHPPHKVGVGSPGKHMGWV